MASVENPLLRPGDYSFYVVGIKNALKVLEEKLLMAETNTTLEPQVEILKEIHTIQKYVELLELTTLRKIGVHKKD